LAETKALLNFHGGLRQRHNFMHVIERFMLREKRFCYGQQKRDRTIKSAAAKFSNLYAFFIFGAKPMKRRSFVEIGGFQRLQTLVVNKTYVLLKHGKNTKEN
jgi:hypothetical protein